MAELDILYGFEYDENDKEKASNKFNELLDELVGAEYDEPEQVDAKQVHHPRGLYEKVELEHDFLLARIKVLNDLIGKIKEAGKDLDSDFYVMQMKRIIEPVAQKGSIYDNEAEEPIIDPDRIKGRNKQILEDVGKVLGSDVKIMIESMINYTCTIEPNSALAVLETVKNSIDTLIEQLTNQLNVRLNEIDKEDDQKTEIAVAISEFEDGETVEQEPFETEDTVDQILEQTDEEEEGQETAFETESEEEQNEGEVNESEQTDEEKEEQQSEEPIKDIEAEEQDYEIEQDELETTEEPEDLEDIASQSPVDAILDTINEELEEETEEEELEEQEEGEEDISEESVWDAHPALSEVKGDEEDEEETKLETTLSERIIESDTTTSAQEEQETASALLKDDILFVEATSDIVKAVQATDKAIFVAAEDSPVVDITVSISPEKDYVAIEFSGSRISLVKDKDRFVIAEEEPNIVVINTLSVQKAYTPITESEQKAVLVLEDGTCMTIEYAKRGRYNIAFEDKLPDTILESYTVSEPFVALANVFKTAEVPEIEAFIKNQDVINESLTDVEKTELDSID